MNKRNEIVNGMTIQELVSVYRFLVEFEYKVNRLKREEDLKLAYPRITDLLTEFHKKVKKKKRVEICKIKQNNDHCGITYCTVSKGCVLYAFLRHLRNSYAHAFLKVKNNGKTVYLEDEYRDKTSMIGEMDSAFLAEILDTIISK